MCEKNQIYCIPDSYIFTFNRLNFEVMENSRRTEAAETRTLSQTKGR